MAKIVFFAVGLTKEGEIADVRALLTPGALAAFLPELNESRLSWTIYEASPLALGGQEEDGAK